MGKDCPGCNPLTMPLKANKRVLIVPELEETDGQWVSRAATLLITRSCLDRKQFGGAILVCACKTGVTRLGSSTVLVHGKASKALFNAYKKGAPDPVVLLLLDPGSSIASAYVQKLLAHAVEDGREVYVLDSEQPTECLLRPKEDQRVVWTIGGPVAFEAPAPAEGQADPPAEPPAAPESNDG